MTDSTVFKKSHYPSQKNPFSLSKARQRDSYQASFTIVSKLQPTTTNPNHRTTLLQPKSNHVVRPPPLHSSIPSRPPHLTNPPSHSPPDSTPHPKARTSAASSCASDLGPDPNAGRVPGPGSKPAQMQSRAATGQGRIEAWKGQLRGEEPWTPTGEGFGRSLGGLGSFVGYLGEVGEGGKG